MFHVEHYGEIVVKELKTYASAAGINLPADDLENFRLYADELHEWNKKINLTAIADPVEVAIKHFLDSLYGMHIIQMEERDVRLLDVGTGPGFPGLPLKIVKADMGLCLLEKNTKKTAFLANLVGKLKLTGVSILNQSIEWLSENSDRVGRFSHVVVRAVRVGKELDGLADLLRNQGKIIIFSTPGQGSLDCPRELECCERIQYSLPLGMGNRSLLVFATR